MKTEKTRFYHSFSDDFCKTDVIPSRVPSERIRRDLPHRVLSVIVYGTAILLSWIYLKLELHVKYEFHAKIEPRSFIYGNHTQPVGDVFIPAYAAFPHRIYTVVGPANYALPVIGRIIPYLGAIPTPSGLRDTIDFGNALRERLDEGHPIVIFPEAHVWEYCSFIRDYSETSFRYPVKYGAPAYALTLVYSPRKHGKKPRTTVHVDGPYYADTDGNERERAQELRDKILAAMKKRAEKSASHIDYIKATT